MSGPPKKKGLKALSSMAVKPEDTAIKPKPSIHATKRPPGPGSSPSTVPIISKKPRLDFSAGSSKPLGPPGTVSPPRPQLDTTWLEFCKSTTIDFETFAESLNDAFQAQKANKAARLIAAVFRSFMEKKIDTHKFFIEYHLLITCAVTIKEHGDKLTNPYLHKCFLNILCWMKNLSPDRQELLSALVISLAEKQQTLDPYYLTTFLHDALGDRNWVDKECASQLLSLLLKPFGTIYPSKEQYIASGIELSYPESVADPTVPNKFESLDSELIMTPVIECLRKCWAADPPNRNVLRTMSMLAGISEVRSIASKRMDSWSQNIKLQRHALELMMFIGCNFGSAADSEHDRDSLSNLLKMRSLKSKQVQNVFNIVLKEIVTRDENNLRMALHLIIANEFGPSQHRFPMNMVLLQTMFGFDNAKTTKIFAQELSSTVISREELAKHARLLTRELFRSSLRNDFNYPLFAESYLNYILEEERRNDLGIEDHVVYRSATEVITMLPLISISPQVKEAGNTRRSGVGLLPDLQNAINKMEKDLSAYYDVVLKWLQYAKNLFMDSKEYFTAYCRYLFLEKSEYYTMMDQGPTEAEFANAIKIFGEFSFTDRHMKLILGEKFNTLSQDDTIQLIYDLAKRATALRTTPESRPIISFVSGEPASALVQRVLDVCLFRPNFLYDGELLPMFVKTIYWKSWIVIILWATSSRNSDTLGSIYETFTMFRFLIHIILTKQYYFPVAFEGLSEEEMLEQEHEIVVKEVEALIRQENLFEKKHNREMGITELTSQLVQTCLMAQNCVRKPPELFLNELKVLASEYHLVAWLSDCRNPDLLKLLIDEYGPSKAMPAIQDLLLTNLTAIDNLDSPVLCEFLMYHLAMEPKQRVIGDDKLNMITSKLRSVLAVNITPLVFFLKKLNSPQSGERLITHRSLNYLFEEGADKLFFEFSRLEKIGCFESAKAVIGTAVADAILFESDVYRTISAISFVAKTLSKENMHQTAVSVSPLAERRDQGILNTIIGFYGKYHQLSRENPNYWPEDMTTSKYTVRMEEGDVSMAGSAVTSTLKLLCRSGNSAGKAREELIKIWFPSNGVCPSVTEDGKPIDVFPESLRTNMLCAEDERITKVALSGVDGATAVQLLSSFGLTNYSASQLIQIVEKIPITEIGIEKAKFLMPFIIAYRYRGAIGGEFFLKTMKEMDTGYDIKGEAMETELLPFPTIEYINIPMEEKWNKAQVSQALKEMTVADSPHLFICPTILVRSAIENKDIANVCVEHFEGQLKFFLANPDAFHEIMMIISSAADRYPEIYTQVKSLAVRLLKSAAVRPALEGYLRKFNQTAQTIMDSPMKVLHRIGDSISDIIMDKRIPKEEELIQQMIHIFGGKAETFVAQMPQRYPPETNIFLLQRILSSFEKKYNPLLVCEFVFHNCRTETSCLKKKEPLTILAKYLAEMVVQEENHLAKAVNVVDRLVDVSGFEALIPVCEYFLILERLNHPKIVRKRAGLLISALITKFPCMSISPFSMNIKLSGPRWKVEQGDRFCSRLITNVFESEETEEIYRSLDYLQQLSNTHPSVVVREFGVMVNQLSVILGKDAREVKSDIRRLTIKTVRQTAITLMPKLQKEDLPHVDTAIAILLAIFERYHKGKDDSSEVKLAEAIVTLCYCYVEHHLENGKDMLLEHGKSLESCCALHQDHPASISLLTQIKAVELEYR